MTTIPVILAADNNYAPYMSVLMYSILKNAKSNPFFDFFLLMPGNFKEEYKQKIETDCQFYENKKLNFVIMNSFSDIKMRIPHITQQTYYRLKAAEILPEKYDKCIYLDVDTIVNCDLAELFNIDLADNYVAGVKAVGYHTPDGNKNHCKQTGLPDINQYINAGVLLLNLKLIRENNLTPVLCEEVKNNYSSQDQDVINKVFYNKIKHLPFKYNVMTYDISHNANRLNIVFTPESINEAKNNPLIIHYADKIKPWHNKSEIFADFWWKYAKESCFYTRILQKYLLHILYNRKQEQNHVVTTLCGLIKIKTKIKIKENKKETRYLYRNEIPTNQPTNQR